MEKKCKIAKWLSEEALQIAVRRRQVKIKEGKETYTHLNAEFQRIARRDKKAFLSDQCKEIGENNRMGKTRDHFKKISNTKGTFHAKMGSIQDRNGMDLTEAEDIKKRWQEYWSGLPFPSLEDLLDPGIKLWSPASQADSLLFELQGSPTKNKYQGLNFYCGKQSIYKVIIATVCIL